MMQLNLPPYPIRVKEVNGRKQILDILPATLLANEVPLQVGEKKVRADSVLYDQHLRPRMIIEYKAPSVPITQKVFDQIFVYNILLHVDYLIVSNGLETYICRMDYDNQKYLFLEDIPNYQNI